MMFFDRLTGVQVKDLPTDILPGRYNLINTSGQKTTELILDDGSGVIKFDYLEKKFIQIEYDNESEAEVELAIEAIVSISDKFKNCTLGSKVSPMLPSEMASQCELDDLESSVIEVVRSGHLHSISDRPRRDLRYDEMVAPVSRARRLASSAINHLSSHSDCWQQRTLMGIKPRKILARFSEDDYSIYENRLYKRLLDRLEVRLAKRLARINSLNLRLESALDFQNSEKTHYRLREEICKVWGESYSDQSTSVQLESGKKAIAKLGDLLRTLRGLKQRGLYILVSPNASVPAQVHRTNIINHDPHYRHLPTLWEKLKNVADRQLTPEEQLEKQRHIHACYKNYVGLVLQRSLEKYGIHNSLNKSLNFVFGGEVYELNESDLGWVLSNSSSDSLSFVAIAWFGRTIAENETIHLNRILCWPGNTESEIGNQRIPISPLDLFVVEKMGRAIDEWLILNLIKNYGQSIGPLPTEVKKLTETWPDNFVSASNHSVKLFSPLDFDQITKLHSVLNGVVSSHVRQKLLTSISQLGSIPNLCGHKSLFTGNKLKGFHCYCQVCERTWLMNVSDKKIYFTIRPKDSLEMTKANGFNWAGREWLEIEVAPRD